MSHLPRTAPVVLLIGIGLLFLVLLNVATLPHQDRNRVSQTNKPLLIATITPTSTIAATSTYSLFLPLMSNRYRYRELVFVSERTALIEDLYRINSDATGLENLTNTPERSEWFPAWSPDGSKLAFASQVTGDYGIYVMNADGSAMTRLTDNMVGGKSIAWSSDGTRIVFDSLLDRQYDIYVIDADGTNLTRLTVNQASDTHPYWSPDGSQIAFWSERNGKGKGDVYLIGLDDTEPMNLTDPNEIDVIPYHSSPWSPDGTKLLFTSRRDDNWEIYSVNRDGTELLNLTRSPGTDGTPTWSPDGTKIIYLTDGSSDSFSVMNSDGSGKATLFSLPANIDIDVAPPIWSPDGTQIAFASQQDSQYEVFVINVDGSGLRRLTDHPTWDYAPVWRP